VFVEPTEPTTDASGATGLKQGFARYRITVSASARQGDAFTPGPERDVAVVRADSGFQVCLTRGSEDGGGTGSKPGKQSPVPGQLLITARTAAAIEGSVTLSEGRTLTFVAPIRPGGEGTLPRLCCS